MLNLKKKFQQLFNEADEDKLSGTLFNLLITALFFAVVCSGLMEPDTLMRDNNRQPLRCQYESKAELQTIPERV